MTVQDVQESLAEIRAIAEDDEAAHSMQDRLTENVLRAISGGEPGHARDLATAVLAVYDIEFERWCS